MSDVFVTHGTTGLILSPGGGGVVVQGGSGTIVTDSAITSLILTAPSAVTNPVWSFNLNFKRGDVPSGYYPVIYESNGALVLSQQFDQIRTWAADGSMRKCTFSMISPDTFGAGGTVTYIIGILPGPTTSANQVLFPVSQ